MYQLRSVVAALCVVAFAPSSFGQVELKWQFTKDKPFYQEMTTTTNQTMKVMSMEIKQTQKQTFYFKWTPIEQKGNDWIIKQTIEGVKMEIEIGGQKIQYDSTASTQQPGPLNDFFSALKKAEFTITLQTAPEVKVVKVEGRDQFIKELSKANQQMEPLLKSILSEDALKQMADPAFAVVPNKAVKKGDTWEKKVELKMGPIGSYDTTYKFTADGADGDLEKIKVETSMRYAAPGADATGLPFKIKSADLKGVAGKSGGTIWFNTKEGRVAKSDLDIELAGNLEIEVGGQVTKVELNQSQKTTMNTTTENPLEKKSSQ